MPEHHPRHLRWECAGDQHQCAGDLPDHELWDGGDYRYYGSGQQYGFHDHQCRSHQLACWWDCDLHDDSCTHDDGDYDGPPDRDLHQWGDGERDVVSRWRHPGGTSSGPDLHAEQLDL